MAVSIQVEIAEKTIELMRADGIAPCAMTYNPLIKVRVCAWYSEVLVCAGADLADIHVV
jgi:hypothetical protein